MKKTRDILLIRHGDVENPTQVIYGRSPISLSSLGRDQLYKLAQKLETMSLIPSVILTSPMKRTRESAEEVKRIFPIVDIVIDENLQEVDMKLLEGKSLASIQQINGDIYDAPEVKDFAVERPQLIVDRMQQALHSALLNNSDEKALFIISHGDPIVLLLWSLLHPNTQIPSYHQMREGIYPNKGEAWHIIIEPESLNVISYKRITADIIK